MKYTIIGSNLQMVTVDLSPGESICAEAGSMVNMSGTVTMDSLLKGGILSGVKRAVAGEGVFLTQFLAQEKPGFVSFAGTMPGRIVAHEIVPECGFIAQREAFLCCDEGVDLDAALPPNIPAGILGGSGFVLQKISGSGTVLLHCCGDVLERVLQPGEVVLVQTGLVVGFESTVRYDIALAGDIRTALLGGEGLILATLTGPGRIILQSANLAKIAAALVPYLPKPEIPVKPV